MPYPLYPLYPSEADALRAAIAYERTFPGSRTEVTEDDEADQWALRRYPPVADDSDVVMVPERRQLRATLKWMAENETPPTTRLQDRLEWDRAVSVTSPKIKGTWITVGNIVSRIVDGWSWADIMRSHPEIDEDDIRACLEWTVANEATRCTANGVIP